MLHLRPPPVAPHHGASKAPLRLLSRPSWQVTQPMHRAVHLPDWRFGDTEQLMLHARRPVFVSASQQGPAPATADVPLRALQTAQPVDRLRYQAKLVFDHFDKDRDGRLSADELTAFFTYASRKVTWSPGLSEVLLQVQAAFSAAQHRDAPKAVAQAAKEAAAAAAADAAAAAGSAASTSGSDEAGVAGSGAMPAAVAPAQGGCDVEEFIDLVRRQVSAVSCSGAYQSSALRADEAARLETQKGLSRQELFAARWVFGLLDFDGDGKLRLEELERAQGIEAFIVDSKLVDADADDDGAINFEEFLVSYAKPKQVGKNVAIMLVNTLLIWAILQLPIDAFMKTLAVAVLLLKPQLVSKPVLAIYDAVQALLSGFKAQVDVAKTQQGRWRAA